MKVRVTVTVDIDPDVWMREYGVERAQVRADVAEHITTDVHAQLTDLGLLKGDQ